MAEARITEFIGETQIPEKVLDFMGSGSCMPREAWRLPSPETLHYIRVCQHFLQIVYETFFTNTSPIFNLRKILHW